MYHNMLMTTKYIDTISKEMITNNNLTFMVWQNKHKVLIQHSTQETALGMYRRLYLIM